MTPLAPEQKARLRALATAARGSSWWNPEATMYDAFTTTMAKATGDFCVAVSPAVVLALLDENEALQKAVADEETS